MRVFRNTMIGQNGRSTTEEMALIFPENILLNRYVYLISEIGRERSAQRKAIKARTILEEMSQMENHFSLLT